MMRSIAIRFWWKETRQILSLWLCVVVAGIFFQCLPLVWLNESHSNRDYQSFLVLLTSALSAAIAAVSAALMFAGEAEQRTANRLRMLPSSIWETASSKIFVSLSSAIVSFIVLALSSLACWHLLTQEGISDLLSVRSTFDSWSRHGQMIVGLWLFAVFYSVLFKRVVNVLLLAMVSEVVLAMELHLWFHANFEWVHTSVIGALLLIDVWLIAIWCERPVRISDFVYGWLGSLRERGVLSLRGRVSRWFLINGAMQAEPLRRERRVLIWAELNRMLWPTVILLATGFLAIVAGNAQSTADWLKMWFVALPAICGFLTFRSQQADERFRFLSERGVLGGRICCIHNTLWLGLAFIIGLVVIITAAMLGSTPTHSMLFPDYRVQVASNSHFLSMIDGSSLIVSVLTLFAFCQWISFSVQRGLYAFLIATVGVFVLVFSLETVSYLALPKWQVLGPMVLLWFLSVLRTERHWFHGENGWLWTLRRVVWTFLPWLLACGIGYGARVWQVPVKHHFVGFEILEERLDTFDTAWAPRVEAVATTLPVSVYEGPWEADPSLDIAAAAQKLLELEQTIPWEKGLDLAEMNPLTGMFTLYHAPRCLWTHAKALKAEGRLNEAWIYYQSALQYTDFLGEQSCAAYFWGYLMQIQNRIYEDVVELAADPNMSDDQLGEIIAWFEDHSDNSYETMMKNQYAVWTQILLRQGRFEDTFREHLLMLGNSSWQSRLMELGSWGERQRAWRLMGQATWLSMPVADINEGELREFQKMQSTTPLVSISPETLINSYKSTIAGYRGTLLALKCERYSRQHGSWPASLTDVEDEPEMRIDPWTKAEYGYAPHGVGRGVQDQHHRKYAEEQPVIWSAGPNHRYPYIESRYPMSSPAETLELNAKIIRFVQL